jgi:hypothetical protein
LVVDVIELWQEFSPFILFLSSQEHFQGKIAPLYNYDAIEKKSIESGDCV